MNDHKWNGYEGMKVIGKGIWQGCIFIAIAIVIHGC